MKKINTSNDYLIFELLNNPLVEVTKDGKIYRDGYQQKYRLNKYGYPFYRLTRNGKKIDLLIHRIVWAKYGDKPLEEGLVINHKDGNKENNDISNLELVYQAENNKHAYATGLRQPVKGHVVNSQSFADQIRQDHANGMSYNTIITKYRNMGYKIGKSYVSQIINNKIWKKEETMLSCVGLEFELTAIDQDKKYEMFKNEVFCIAKEVSKKYDLKDPVVITRTFGGPSLVFEYNIESNRFNEHVFNQIRDEFKKCEYGYVVDPYEVHAGTYTDNPMHRVKIKLEEENV